MYVAIIFLIIQTMSPFLMFKIFPTSGVAETSSVACNMRIPNAKICMELSVVLKYVKNGTLLACFFKTEKYFHFGFHLPALSLFNATLILL